MSAPSSLRLPFEDAGPESRAGGDTRDAAGRRRAVDPRFNVALRASAGTGKTRVLVDRYVNLMKAGVDPANVLAITFTRKAAAEMRERIITTLTLAAARGELPPARWRDLRDRLGDIAIGTIDAFCLSLLREFPLEADVDPGFRMADDTEAPRLVDESLDRALRIGRSIARDDEGVALVFAQLGERRARRGLSALLARRLVAPDLLDRYLAAGRRDITMAAAGRQALDALREMLEAMPGGVEGFFDSGPIHPAFAVLKHGVRSHLDRGLAPAQVWGSDPDAPAPGSDPNSDADAKPHVSALFAQMREHFLTQDGQPRRQLAYPKADFATERDWRRHRDAVAAGGPAVARILARYRHDLNVVVSRGVRRMFQVALTEYQRTLDAHAVLDFPAVLLRALDLLRQMDEFAQSRFRLESRYHHILVDEFQDTSQAQWELVSLLVRSWGEGAGLTHAGPLPPSIFIVGDPKQSIYGFRDADVSILQQAGGFLERLRPDGDVRRSISRSFRSVPSLLAFVNDVCADLEKSPRPDAFRYEDDDRFPVETMDATSGGAGAPPTSLPALGDAGSEALGLIAADSAEGCAARAATEVERLLRDGVVRDRETGVARPARPGDIAILFRTRDSHREFEDALEARGIPAYVYKGLGFFDADEIKDVLALLWYLADPQSDRRAAAWLRSRFVGLSDVGLRQLAPGIAGALTRSEGVAAAHGLDARDAQRLTVARAGAAGWLPLVDRLPPSELLDRVLHESAYAVELRGPRLPQARENLKKIRALIRRIQNRGYLTLARLTEYIDRLSVGDESNAVIDALDAVNLMTVHAAKGLEFPIVFVVNLARGTGGGRDPIRVSAGGEGDAAVSVAIGDFQSDADDEQPGREREETKRLLYVALTRARDRLYLASVVKDGQLQPGRGSLAEVLPSSLVTLFAAAESRIPSPESRIPNPGNRLTWHAASGAAHSFAVCADDRPLAGRSSAPVIAYADDLSPLSAPGPAHRPVIEPYAEPSSAGEATIETGSDRLLGSLVHRLLQRVGFDADLDDEHVRAILPELLRSGEHDGTIGIEHLAGRTARAYRAVCDAENVRAIVTAGTSLHEIPFTLRTDAGRLRGTIDCLVRSGDGRVTVLEFKTGRRRPEHESQLEIYREAAARLFPDSVVEAQLVYAGDR